MNVGASTGIGLSVAALKTRGKITGGVHPFVQPEDGADRTVPGGLSGEPPDFAQGRLPALRRYPAQEFVLLIGKCKRLCLTVKVLDNQTLGIGDYVHVVLHDVVDHSLKYGRTDANRHVVG